MVSIVLKCHLHTLRAHYRGLMWFGATKKKIKKLASKVHRETCLRQILVFVYVCDEWTVQQQQKKSTNDVRKNAKRNNNKHKLGANLLCRSNPKSIITVHGQMKWNQLTCNKQSRTEWVNDSNYERFAPKKIRPNDENYTDHYLVHVREPSKNFVPNRMQTYTSTGLLKLGRKAAHKHTHTERETDRKRTNTPIHCVESFSNDLFFAHCNLHLRNAFTW